MYSNTDKLVPPAVSDTVKTLFNSIICSKTFCYGFQDVESFANFRQKIGVPVETVCFDDAEHVKLYIKYPQKYIQCVCKFVNNCLANAPYRCETSRKYD